VAGQNAAAQNALSARLGLGTQLASNLNGLAGGFGSNITDLLGQQGAIGAGNALAQGQASANMFGGLTGAINDYAARNRVQDWINQARGGNGFGLAGGAMPGLSPAPNFGGNYSNAGVISRLFGGGLGGGY
jgi:hypothetical protein